MTSNTTTESSNGLVLAQKPAQTVSPPSPEGPATPAGAPPIQAKPTRAERKARAKAGGSAEAASWPWLDVAAAATLSVVAAITSTSLPSGPLRMAIGLTMILFVPGYLLIQAFAVPAATGMRRGWQALASLGISPAVVGILALSTSVVQGGFRLDAILILNTVACLGFAGAALVRRRALAHADPKAAEMPQAATAKSGPVRP